MVRWLVAAAWPYVYSIPHLGNLIGAPLSADVFARFLRKMGEEVLFVSGSDEHGTPIEAEARKRGIPPRQLTDEMHERISELFDRFGISFDNYTRTESSTHVEFVRDFYSRVYENGHIFSREVELLYCENDGMFLPDRFVVGTCPYCGNPSAYGDQCDVCGRLLRPTDLIDPKCVFCGSTPVSRRSRHWFFDLPKFALRVRLYIERNENLPENARNMSLAMIREGLEPRSLTRDCEWGIPAPFPGAEGKTIYVWMEAVLGYLSAVKELGERRGDPSLFDRFWRDPETRAVYFIGKDNIPFHTVILPALLMASGEGYVLPYSVASTEFLMFEGEKFSKSKGVGIWLDEALELLDPDYWRYYLIAIRPERRDSSFSWSDFESKINDELNAILGNFVHRVLSFLASKFGGEVPGGSGADRESAEALEEAKKTARRAEELALSLRLRDALRSVVGIARIGNRFLNYRAPWEDLSKDRRRAEVTMATSVSLVKALAYYIEPFMPFSAERLWNMLGLDGDPHSARFSEAFEPLP
ncbi:MAG: methionine--tRNA ligase, partial [Thermoproteota archaeon]